MELERPVQQAVGQPGAERMLQVHLVALQHQIGVLAAPHQQHPEQVVLDHRDHGVRNVALLLRQLRVQVLVELLAQITDDDVRVGDLGAVQLDERQLALLGAQSHLVVDVLFRWGRRGGKNGHCHWSCLGYEGCYIYF